MRLADPERREERKVVTVLFADLVGFTSRSEQLDVEDVQETLVPFHATLRRVLEGFGGTVEKFIGDAVMAVFGAPVAHEDDAERAVRAALALHAAIADLRGDLHLRIGVNTGEALVSLNADPLAGQGMVAGDVVNTAARLQSAASVDRVLVGEATYRSCEHAIVFETHESIAAKGKTEPVACWTAVAPRSLVPIATRESFPLVGRERERQSLVDAFEQCRTERRSKLVTIVGVPGIGKSRLVAEFGSYIESDTALTTWRHGHVLSYGRGVAFYALAEIVKQECGIVASDDLLTASVKLDKAIAALGFEGSDARWVRNQVAPLVALEAAGDGSGQSEAFAGWRAFLTAIAERSPTVIVLDDLHWADDALLDFLDGLVERITDVPLLLLTTARPELLERRPGFLSRTASALAIELRPLTPLQTTALISEIIDPSLLPADAEALLIERAGGNPLYAQEYVRALVERGAGTELPETVQGIIAARLDGLSADEKSFLQDAAVIGATSWLGTVCALGGRERADAQELMLRLERKQLLYYDARSGGLDEIECSFAHAVIREVAYAQLPRAARAERHERAAAWLEGVATDRADTAELIAHHYTMALELETSLGHDTETIRPSALVALVGAVHQAAARHDHTAVVNYAEAALTLRPNRSVRAELLVRRAIARHIVGDPDESLLLEARDAAVAEERTEDAVHLTYLLGLWADYYAADGERAIAYDSEARRLAVDLPPGPITTLAAYSLAFRLFQSGRYDETIELADTEIARATEVGADSAVGLMLIWRGSARVDGGDEDGLVDLRDALRILDEGAHPKAAIAAYVLGEVFQGLGRLREASAAYETAAASAHRFGDADDESTAWLGLARLAFHRGQPPTGLATLEANPTDMSEWVAINLSNVQGRLLLEDSPHEAAEAARRPLAYARRTDNLQIACDALALAARAALAVGDDEAAGSFLDEYVDAWTRIGTRLACSASLIHAGLGLVACDRRQELAAAADLLHIPTPWRAAAHALAEHRYGDAAAILDAIPSIPLRDAAILLGRTR